MLSTSALHHVVHSSATPTTVAQLRRLASEADLALGSREDQVKADILEYKRAKQDAALDKQRRAQQRREETTEEAVSQW